MLIREALFQYTKQDSYEFPSQRTTTIRDFIRQLDEQIEENLPEDHDHWPFGVHGVIAQLVERLLCKQDVNGSSPFNSINI